ncbi:MAG: PAS domain S-box protein [Acidimicrobiales bacterium]|nr:PAS domain S-box protein [Acidimicrobiales bacterium]MCB1015234.1 PAS domain S-box protein [Acidimicrobiales bacterium]
MTTPDEGGEAPCFSHLLDEPPPHTDQALAELLRQLADAIVIADADGTITFWNDAATRLFGWPAHEALGRSLDLIIPERLRDRHWTGYRQTMATGHTSYGDRLLEVPALHRDGRTLSIAFTVSLMHEADGGTPTAIAAVLRDDTEHWQERRRLRAELTALRDGDATRPADPSVDTR